MTNSIPDDQTKKIKRGLWAVVLSTCAAAFGVQTHKNHEKDFAEGSIKTYIVAGVIFTLVFIGLILLGVQWVLRSAGVS